ncbi:MAG: hypothetical protein OWT28_11520 [Firmicutes bacterium]|nr:hypothetical protein [Bacillota bacterium]
MSSRRITALRRYLTGLLLLLIVQFLSGMVTNLWVSIPSDVGGASTSYGLRLVQAAAWAGHHAPLALRLHAIVGVILGILACIPIVYAIMSRSWRQCVLGLIGLLSVLGAAWAGLDFVLTGGNGSSMVMSTTFIIAFVTFALQWHGLHPSASAMDPTHT